MVLDGADGFVNSGDVDGLVFEVAEFLGGEPHAARTARPVASLLFTDLVGSTATARSMGGADMLAPGWSIGAVVDALMILTSALLCSGSAARSGGSRRSRS